MKYFLAKTDPETYSIDDLARDKQTTWDGVRNPQARIFIRMMQPGDLIFIYHSQGESKIVGLAKVISEPRDDAKDPKSSVMDIEFIKKYDEADQVTLQEIKESGKFDDWRLVRQGRLSTMDVPDEFLKWKRAANLLKL